MVDIGPFMIEACMPDAMSFNFVKGGEADVRFIPGET
jgi:hypothetical protein